MTKYWKYNLQSGEKSEIMKITDKDFKTTVINVSKDLKENTNILNKQLSISIEKLKL